MLTVALLGVGDGPLVVLPVAGYPDSVVIRVGDQFRLHVRAEDIEVLSAALDKARQVLSGTCAGSIEGAG